MEFIHSMIRVKDLEKTLGFFVGILGLKEIRRTENETGRFTIVFLKSNNSSSLIELTHNWDHEVDYSNGRNFGHLAFQVDDIYKLCEKLQSHGVQINRPPRDGYMAFIKTPDNVTIELIQKGERLELIEPWLSMENSGEW